MITAPVFADDLAAPSSTAPETATGAIIVFLPEGGEASLVGPGGRFTLQSGQGLDCPAGDYLLEVRHPGFAIYMKKVSLRPDAEIVIAPSLEPSAAYRAAQLESLESYRGDVARKRALLGTGAVVAGALAVASAVAVGGAEYLLAASKSELDSTYAKYRSASAADAPGLWTDIEDIKGKIGVLRLYELAALGAAGLFAGASWAAASATPTAAGIDRQIELLRKAAVK